MNPLNCLFLLRIVNIYRTFTVLIKVYEINNFKNLIRAERSNSEFSAKKVPFYAFYPYGKYLPLLLRQYVPLDADFERKNK